MKATNIDLEHLDLRQWIFLSGMTRQEFAELVGVTKNTIDRLCARITQPSLDLAIRIENVTEGLVRPRNLVSKSRMEP